jgi:hypothetical protein
VSGAIELADNHQSVWSKDLDPILLSLLTFFLGLFIGHKLSLNRARRQEFNEAAIPIRTWLLSEIDGPSSIRPRPSSIDFDAFVSCMSWWQRSRFQAAMKRQNAVRQSSEAINGYGEVLYPHSGELKDALRDCLRYTERR